MLTPILHKKGCFTADKGNFSHLEDSLTCTGPMMLYKFSITVGSTIYPKYFVCYIKISGLCLCKLKMSRIFQ